ncbi:uncharacterized protein LOC126784563 [Argentina anserina]|uniref:uncharacterized protein LOC126784563 n=1 Tax=Argentina anserina TaxID=57926 RepID=UPI0021766228|nr:uncharacterized protein LOC126784563 [Potentilla anserina]
MKKVHPSLSKPSISYNVASSSTPKKLRRLPHVFAKVLELPLHSCADVSIQETSESFRFSVAVPADHQVYHDEVVQANAIEIYPGVTKIVIQKANGGDFSPAVNVFGDHFDKWRYRLPASTRPELANATYAGQVLVVTVPKNHDHDRSTREEQKEDENVRVIVIQ